MRAFLRRSAVWLTLLPVLALMTVIFCLSAQPATQSDRTSGGIVSRVIELLFPGFAELEPAQQRTLEKAVTRVVRKTAHFAEYAALGGALLGHLQARSLRRPLRRKELGAFALGTLYAASDELHQLFVPGRSGELRDVLLDALGVAAGVWLLWRLTGGRKKPNKG